MGSTLKLYPAERGTYAVLQANKKNSAVGLIETDAWLVVMWAELPAVNGTRIVGLSLQDMGRGLPMEELQRRVDDNLFRYTTDVPQGINVHR